MRIFSVFLLSLLTAQIAFANSNINSNFADVKVDLTKLNEKWSKTFSDTRDTKGSDMDSIVITDRALYFPAYNIDLETHQNALIALNPETGSTLWSVTVDDKDGFFHTGGYLDDLIYTLKIKSNNPLNAYAIEAYDAQTGSLVYSKPNNLLTRVPLNDGLTEMSIQDHHIYLDIKDSVIGSFDSFGDLEWSANKNQKDYISGAPALIGKYVLRHGKSDLYIINQATGNLEGTIRATDQEALRTPYVTGANIVWDEATHTAFTIFRNDNWETHDSSRLLVAFNIDEKKVIWKTHVSDKDQNIGTNLVLVDGVIYVGSEDLLYAVDSKSGRILWTWQSPKIITNLLATPDYLFVSDGSNFKTYIISIKKRNVVKVLGRGGRLKASNNTLYITEGYAQHPDITAIQLN